MKTVLEVGCGLSTLLWLKLGYKVFSFETDQKWIDYIQKLAQASGLDKNLFITKWGATEAEADKLIADLPSFDIAFCDGPAGGGNREFSTKLCTAKTDFLLIHDAGRHGEKDGKPKEREWQAKYVVDGFEGPIKGGHRTHLWLRKNSKYTEMRKNAINKKHPKRKGDSKGLIRFAFNGRGEGGAERTCTWIMNRFYEMGYEVIYHSPNNGVGCGSFRKEGNPNIKMADYSTVGNPCDILVLYTNDHVWEFKTPELHKMFENIQSKRKVMCLNYRVGPIGTMEAKWTRGWDSYLFLNSYMKDIVLARYPQAKCKVLAPPADVSKFFHIEPNYKECIKLIRHSSQGDAKYPKSIDAMVKKILETREDLNIRLMPAPTFLKYEDKRLIRHGKNQPAIEEYLELGNVFWYTLPDGYEEGGPRVILEAMAAGLPVICDNHSGMIDRVNDETGWKCNDFTEQINVIKSLTSEIIEKKGKAAKDYAKEHFRKELWIEFILGEFERTIPAEIDDEKQPNGFLENTKKETDEWVQKQINDIIGG